MPSSSARTALLSISLILFVSLVARGQANDIGSTKLDTSLDTAKRALTVDTLAVKVDSSSDIQDTLSLSRDTVAAKKDTLDIIVSSEGLNTIPGFRIQIGSTQDLSEAMGERAKAETILDGYNVYIIYDSPYYKVRAGDFRSRYDATQAAGFVSDHGFSTAWVVPDNVFKNPHHKTTR